MIEQLKTIRAGLETATCYSMLGVDAHSVQLALTALTQLEAMVGEPTLVVQHGEICYKSRNDDQSYGMWCPVTPDSDHGLVNGTNLYAAAPLAQQYEAGDVASAAAQGFRDGQAAQRAQRPDFHDMWAGYLKDGETPFERFMRERKDLDALTKLYQRALAEKEQLKAQQAQPTGPQAATIEEAARDVGKWLNERPNREIDLRHVAMLVGYVQQAQAEAVPPEDWSVFNSGAEVASGLTWAEAWDYMTPSRIERGWTAVCVANKSNIGIGGEKGGA